jgi:SAM-dependent methyltransferase
MRLPDFFCCPECHGGLSRTETVVQCEQCRQEYPVAGSQIDLRPRRRLVKNAPFVVDPVDPIWSPPAEGKSPASHTLRSTTVRTLSEIIPNASEVGSTALEVGCGSRRDVRHAIERAGFCWLGVDWSERSAPYLADVHALPFRDDSFPLVASDAVLEHVRYPHIAMREMARVLRPDGVMVGEVAFLQPYHTSYFHMTHEAVLDLSRYAGLQPTLIANGAASSFLYLAKRALKRWVWVAWPADWTYRTLAKRKQLGKTDIHFACTVLFAARKRPESARQP